ncbi:hypothetical protein WICMUC_005093 [Wickerhamomyces mucosus]|uniref:Telomere length regulation protein conserved domain-containing protein n=1 Tax=Wickerhamomyces mucosus TaxID=1378264 RepID=A0A9P8PCV2_9ASCO|nr:hypothetical protein WICMUC_005093 [Wickerhamomyces mucosus]
MADNHHATINIESDIKLLQDSPTQKQINQAITNYNALKTKSITTQLKFLNTLIKYILPVYKKLSKVSQLMIKRCFLSVNAINNLLNQIKITNLEIYRLFLKDLLLMNDSLSTLIENSNSKRFETDQIGILVFGSKILNSFGKDLDVKDYLNILVHQLLNCYIQNINVPNEFILKYLSLHPIESSITFFNFFLKKDNLDYLKKIFNSMNSLQKREFLLKFFIPFVLGKYLNLKNFDSYIKIFHQLNIKEIEFQLIKYSAESSNLLLKQFVSILIDEKVQHLEKLLNIWGNDSYTSSIEIPVQQLFTFQLISLSKILSKEEKSKISRDEWFLNGISKKLELNDAKLRNLLMILAKEISNGEVKYEIDDETKADPIYNITKLNVGLTDIIDFDSLISSNDDTGIVTIPKKETIVDSDDDEEYSENEESDPVFLKDLISRFQANNITSITNLLSITINLVRQKSSFEFEIEYYSPELVSVLVGLINKFDENNFEQIKINAIVSVLVTYPKSINTVLDVLFTGDCSLQQRMIILSSISLAARELSGEEDDFVSKPKFAFPTKELPNSFEKLEITGPKIEELPSDNLSQGQVIRKSSRLTKPLKKTKINKFSKIAHQWFYPLANAYRQGIQLGSNSEIFIKHYVQTLKLITLASYPRIGFEDMVTVYEEIEQDSGIIIE